MAQDQLKGARKRIKDDKLTDQQHDTIIFAAKRFYGWDLVQLLAYLDREYGAGLSGLTRKGARDLLRRLLGDAKDPRDNVDADKEIRLWAKREVEALHGKE